MINKILQLIARLIRISIRRPNDLKHILGITSWAVEQIIDAEADVRSLPLVEVLDICPNSQRLILQSFPSVGASVSTMECAALSALCGLVSAHRVFEFGTYKGVSTTQLALNIGKHGIVFTLDLPEDHPAYILPILRPEEREIASEGQKGILIPKDLRKYVKFLQSDSATFDESAYLDSMDLVFVDGAHSYEYVKNDSEKGWRMLKSGGVLAWHDCTANHRDVVRYIKNSGHICRLICGTTIAFTIKP